MPQNRAAGVEKGRLRGPGILTNLRPLLSPTLPTQSPSPILKFSTPGPYQSRVRGSGS